MDLRAGFTFVELLVVIAIVGMLVAILLPAVQSARESARRLQCASNMKNVALAVLQYESSRRELPAAGLVQKKADHQYEVDIFNPFAGPQLSWLVLILPQLEQPALFDQFDLSRPVYSQADDPQATHLDVLLCPSDEARDRWHQMLKPGMGVHYASLAKSNFAAYVSPFHVDLQYLYPGALVGDPQPLRSIPDLSATLAVSEVRTLDHLSDERGAWALAWNGASLLAFDMHPANWGAELDGSGAGDQYTTQNRAPYVPSPDSRGEAQPPNNQGPNFDTLKYCTAAATSPRQQSFEAAMPCSLHSSQTGVGVQGHMSAAPRSLHPGGVNGAFLDGHVVFLRDDIDEFVMAGMVSVTD
ncbi:MAG: DUF1559 domain-containing protein [Planctomycetales bacterium]|nr:DUF1559 domain-containing protein [Planctomycetales bacterium]